MRADRFGNRLEPALDAAIQRVVVAALVMRLMRLAGDLGPAGAERGKAAAAIAPAIGHEGIDAEIVPAARERIPTAHPGWLQHIAHLGRARKGEAVARDGLCDLGEPI